MTYVTERRLSIPTHLLGKHTAVGTGEECEMGSIDQYLAAAAANGARDTTLYTSEKILRRVEADIGPLEHATPEQLAEWWATRTHLAAHTRRSELSRLTAWSRWALEVGLVDQPICARLRAPRAPRPAPRPIPEDHLAQAIEAATGRCRSWMLLGAYAGLRACECAALRPDELTDDEVFVRSGKGGHAARIPAHPRLREVVVDWPADTAPWVVSHTVNRHLRALGIPSSMHKLRARFATRVYANTGNDLRLTQELMRHASPTTTVIYIGWDPASARRAVDGL